MSCVELLINFELSIRYVLFWNILKHTFSPLYKYTKTKNPTRGGVILVNVTFATVKFVFILIFRNQVLL